MYQESQRVYDHHANNKSSFWRRENRRSRAIRLLKLFVLIIVLFALINFLIKIPGWFQNINRPFEEIQTDYVQYGRVNNEFRTNILLISVSDKNNLQDVALASFSAEKSTLSIFQITTTAKIYSYGSDQSLSLGATYLGKPYFDSDFDSIYVVSMELLALPLDGYFFFSSDSLEFDEQTIQSIKHKLGSLGLFTNSLSYKSWLNENMETNYSISAIFGLALDVRQLNVDKLIFVPLSVVVDKKELNTSDVDKIIQKEIVDTEIAKESAVVEISGNSFRHLVKRVVNNLGASIVNIGSTANIPKTRVILDSDKNKVAERLAQFLKVKVEKEKIESGADVRVIVGDDFEANFYGELP